MRLAKIFLVCLLLAAAAGLSVQPALARSRLKDVCRIKGQEQNTLQGLGIIVGLKGTGDGGAFLPTIRSLAQTMDRMGNPIGRGGPLELKDAKNIALVMVTATVPGVGARQGDEIDCVVSSIGAAKSLSGGRLFMTPLQGPQFTTEGARRVYAFAQGPIHLDDDKMPTSGRVHGGCRLEEDFFNPFTKDGKITLVIDQNHADFEFAQEVADLINSELSVQSTSKGWARALNQQNVEVGIPPQYTTDPVLLISQLMALSAPEISAEARVVINERAGSIVIGSEVTIGAVVVTHKNIVVEATGTPPADRFIAVDSQPAQATTLKALVEALNSVKVPTADVIEIIKGLDRNGKLHGSLIIE